MLKRSLLIGVLTVALAMLGFSIVMADGPVAGRPGRTELRFLEGMIDHHQMALDMANDCLIKASSEDVLQICQDIIDGQSAEITQMQIWLRDWYNVEYAPVSMMSMLSEGLATAEPMEGMDHGGMEMGGSETGDALFTDPPMTMGMMAGLNRLEGREYEIAWLEAMIDHHDDALHMSERLLPRVQHEELRQLGETIIEDQTAEITAMEELLVVYQSP
jgi:uncharacterized protein (DUF305 family)